MKIIQHPANKHLFIVLIFVTLSCLLAGCDTAKDSPSARQGVLNLSSWDFEKDSIAKLSGEWELYWQQLLVPDNFQSSPSPQKDGHLTIPGNWQGIALPNERLLGSTGYATLRLVMRITPDQQQALAVHIPTVIGDYRLWVDGQLLFGNGTVGTVPEKEAPRLCPRTATFYPVNETIEFIIQLSNYHFQSGGIWSPVTVGLTETIQARQDRQKILAIGMATSFLLMGFYHLLLYVYRRQDPASLYFGIYCLLWLTNLVTTVADRWLVFFLFPSLSMETVLRFDLISYYCSVPVIVLFFQVLFPDDMPRRMARLFLVPALIFSLYQLGNTSILTNTLGLWYHLITLGAMLCIFLTLVRAVKHKRPRAFSYLTGSVILALCGVNDILHDLSIIHTGYYVQIGLLFFSIIQAITLAGRFSRAFVTSERLVVEMEEKNIALAKLDKIKDDFLANTSHELRTPLASIIGISESLLAGAAGTLSKVAADNLSMIATSGRRLATLVNDILDFAKLKNKDLPLDRKSVDIRAIADTVLRVLTPLANKKKLCLSNDISPDFPPVYADEYRLQQIFYNLIGNSIKFTESGEIRVTATAGNPRVEIAVRDTGIGIPEDKLEDIFLAFEQVDTSSSRRFGGTGLGIAISKHLIKLHGGEIRVESVEEQGTVFFFTMPLSNTRTVAPEDPPSLYPLIPELTIEPSVPPVSEQAGEVTPATPQSGKVFSILVVDDEPVNLQVVHNHLTLEGMGVQTVTSGSAALESIDKGQKPDLILLDIMMPKMTGYEVCRRLRQQYSNTELPIIMLTARNRVADLVEGFAAGANDYLTKPFTREELLARITSHLKTAEAYRTLKENRLLKNELKGRQQTVLDLYLIQQRLAGMLDTVAEMVIAITESQEIGFCNCSCCELLGCELDDILGQPVWKFFIRESAETARKMIQGKSWSLNRTAGEIDVVLLTHQGKEISTALEFNTLEFDDMRMTVFILYQKNVPSTAGKNNTLAAASTHTLINELNRNQLRLRTLEETLNGLLPQLVEQSPRFLQQLKTIDTALAQVSQTLLTPERQEDKAQLGVTLLNLSLAYWSETGATDKFELARQSGLWKVYTNKDGWERSQTLDRYLDPTTLPKRPRWKQVMATADFVLAAYRTSSPLRDQLEAALVQFRLLCR